MTKTHVAQFDPFSAALAQYKLPNESFSMFCTHNNNTSLPSYAFADTV